MRAVQEIPSFLHSAWLTKEPLRRLAASLQSSRQRLGMLYAWPALGKSLKSHRDHFVIASARCCLLSVARNPPVCPCLLLAAC